MKLQHQTLSMLEFGNQEAHDKYDHTYVPFFSRGFKSNTKVMKYFFRHIGIKHTSIDINGWDSALPLDCRQDLTPILSEKYDIITNMGFGEHVGEGDKEHNLVRNQYTFFKSMHNLGKINTIYYHEFIINWPSHGVCNYNITFILDLCQLCKYDIILAINDPRKKDMQNVTNEWTPEVAIFAYKKTSNNDFITFEEFSKIPGLRSIYNTYYVDKNIRKVYHDYKGTQWLLTIDISMESPENLAREFCETVGLTSVSDEYSNCVHQALNSIETSDPESFIQK
jgi:hypothetical protein